MLTRLHHWMEMGSSKKDTCVAKLCETGIPTNAESISASNEAAQSVENISCNGEKEKNLVNENIISSNEKTVDDNVSVNHIKSEKSKLEKLKDSNISDEGTEENNLAVVTEVSDTLQNLSIQPDNVDKASGSNELQASSSVSKTVIPPPEFPLFPISKGFCMTLRSHMRSYKLALDQLSEEPKL